MEQSTYSRTYDRQPLVERQPRTGPPSTKSKTSVSSKITSPTRIPHHESRHPEGNLSIVSRDTERLSRPRNVAEMIIQEEELESNKRDSQISNTSTASTGKSKRKTHIGPWQLGKTLGKGATGRVRLAKHSLTGQTAAIKIVSKKSAAMVQSASMRQMDNDSTVSSNISGIRTMPFGIEREIVIMKLIEHPNIISLYDIWENRGELYLVLEYVEGGELFDYIMRNRALPEVEAVRLLRQLLAGLAYCHRFNICHRDLKPENILLDKDHNIKIADFGMAAMQPVGQYLTTSCGSPHYAAPEIIAGKQYRGNQSDIWSAGIILYAMLNGFLPFDGEDLHDTLRIVKKGEYYLSPNLSREASDLIQLMLQKNPKHRITMKDIWKHPLLRKHEQVHAAQALPRNLPGPPLPLTTADCGPRRIKPEEIDRELLRNLQILWHGLGEKEVKARLTSSEPNYEKLFYWALVRFREDQMENYPGETLQHSASDYHHAKPKVIRLPKSSTRSALHQRKTSQFSIVSEDSLSRNAYYKNPAIAASKATQGSYDPYRASRKPITQIQKPGTTIIVRRSGSDCSSRPAPPPQIGIVDGLPSTIPEVPSLTLREIQKLLIQKRATYSTVSSRSSLASLQRHRVFRASASYKRNVLFQHRPPSRLTNHSRSSSLQISVSRPVTRDSNQALSDSRSTPSLSTPSHVARPKRPASDLDLHATRAGQAHWREDTRHVSAELSKICEEAFNRSSVSCASGVSQHHVVDSPATTISVPEAILAARAKDRNVVISPALQSLLDRRQRMIQTWGDGDPQLLSDLVATLDYRIVAQQKSMESACEKRAASDPTGQRSRAVLGDDTMHNLNQHRAGRAVSDPSRTQDRTIRMVTPDPLSPISRHEIPPSKAMPVNSLQCGGFYQDEQRDSYDHRLIAGQALDPILEDPSRSPHRQQAVERKWSWLGRKGLGSSEDLPPTPPRKDTPKVIKHKEPSVLSTASIESKNEGAAAQDTEEKKRSWFQKVFMKRRKEKTLSDQDDHKVIAGEEDLDSSEDMLTVARPGPESHGWHSMASLEGVAVTSATPRPEAGQNWLAKFLHLKPATGVLVMQLGKAQARKEVVKILREWRKFGMKDISVEKRPTGDIVRARVDAQNYLRIKPVQFYASVYTVLERGKVGNLSIIKFTQEKGAASSFHRVVDTMESVLKENGVVLSDNEKRKKVLKSMKQAGL